MWALLVLQINTLNKFQKNFISFKFGHLVGRASGSSELSGSYGEQFFFLLTRFSAVHML